MDNLDATLTQARALLADLDGYIQRRAGELAAPHIADAERRALNAEQLFDERLTDLKTEMGRQMRALENRLDDLHKKHGLRRDPYVAARRDAQKASAL